jgi:hypothetical protein
LWEANSSEKAKKNLNYLAYGPFTDVTEYEAWVTSVAGNGVATCVVSKWEGEFNPPLAD